MNVEELHEDFLGGEEKKKSTKFTIIFRLYFCNVLYFSRDEPSFKVVIEKKKSGLKVAGGESFDT